MDLLKFNDKCEITNYSGRYDEYDNPIGEIIYQGGCMYQSGNQANKEILVRSDVVYIVGINHKISANDLITIHTHLGECIKGAVSEAYPVELPLSGNRYTRIVIKQGIEE